MVVIGDRGSAGTRSASAVIAVMTRMCAGTYYVPDV